MEENPSPVFGYIPTCMGKELFGSKVYERATESEGRTSRPGVTVGKTESQCNFPFNATGQGKCCHIQTLRYDFISPTSTLPTSAMEL